MAAENIRPTGPNVGENGIPAPRGASLDSSPDSGVLPTAAKRSPAIVTSEPVKVDPEKVFLPDVENGYFSHKRGDRDVMRIGSSQAFQTVYEGEREDIEAGIQPYIVYDSPLEMPKEEGGPPVMPFEYNFGIFAPVETTFREFLEESTPPDAVGVEVGGPGSNLFAGFKEGTFTNTFGMTLADGRSQEQKERDASRGHDLILGPFQENWEELEERLDGRKVNVLFSRMEGGYAAFNPNPYEFAAQADRAYQFLSNDRGLMYLQVPFIVTPVVEPWLKEMRANHENEIGVQAAVNVLRGTVSLEIEKLPGAPERLPLLDSRTVYRTYETTIDNDKKYVSLAEMHRRAVALQAMFSHLDTDHSST